MVRGQPPDRQQLCVFKLLRFTTVSQSLDEDFATSAPETTAQTTFEFIIKLKGLVLATQNLTQGMLIDLSYLDAIIVEFDLCLGAKPKTYLRRIHAVPLPLDLYAQ